MCKFLSFFYCMFNLLPLSFNTLILKDLVDPNFQNYMAILLFSSLVIFQSSVYFFFFFFKFSQRGIFLLFCY